MARGKGMGVYDNVKTTNCTRWDRMVSSPAPFEEKKVIFNPPYVLTIALSHYNIFSAEKASFSVHKSCPTCSVVFFMLQYPHGGLLESIWYHMRWCGVTTFDLWPLNPLFGGHFGSICWFCLIFLSKNTFWVQKIVIWSQMTTWMHVVKVIGT